MATTSKAYSGYWMGDTRARSLAESRNRKAQAQQEQQRQTELRSLSRALAFERQQGIEGYQNYLSEIQGSPSEKALKDFEVSVLTGQTPALSEADTALATQIARAPVMAEIGMAQQGMRQAAGARGAAPGSATTDSAIRGMRLRGLGQAGQVGSAAFLASKQANFQARQQAAGGLRQTLAAHRGAQLPAVAGLAEFRANTPIPGAQSAGQFVQPFQFTPSQRNF